MLASGSVQEASDLALVAHLATLESSVPFLHFFDGFRTSHEVQKIESISYDDIAKLVNWDKIRAFRDRALNPERPHQAGTAQNPDVFFQNREAANKYYDAVPAIVAEAMEKVSKLTGRHYQPFTYHGAADAENVIILMGSGTEAVHEAVDALNKAGQKLGVQCTLQALQRSAFLSELPRSAKVLTVLDRTKESVPWVSCYIWMLRPCLPKMTCMTSKCWAAGGLGSKEFTLTMIKTVFENATLAAPKNHFTIGH